MSAIAQESTAPSHATNRFGPARLFRAVSIAEAITWTLLLIGMVLKYVTKTTELGVRVFGVMHGAVFLTYCVTTVLVWIDQRWSFKNGALGLLSAIPPFVTLLFDRRVESRGMLADTWRLRSTEGRGFFEEAASWVVRHPVAGALLGLVMVAALFSVALILGPPIG